MKFADVLILAMAFGGALGATIGNANGQGNGIGNGNEKETTFSIKGAPVDDSNATGYVSIAGEMEDIDDLTDLADRKTFKLYGLKQNPNVPIVFKVVSTSVEEVPDMIAPPADGDSTGNGEVGTTTKTFWYGEEVGSRRKSLYLVVGADGSILGSCTDGEMTYTVQSVDDDATAAGNGKKLKYWAVEGKDLPPLDGDIVPGDDDNRGGLRGIVYGASQGDLQSDTAEGYGQRDLQSTTTVRIITLFTSQSRSILGDSGCGNYHSLAVSQMNDILGRSRSNVRFESVGWSSAYFPDTARRTVGGDYLNALKNSGDGYFDYVVNSWQPYYGSDVVVIVGENVYTGRASNVGSRTFGPSPYKYGYAEVNRHRGTLVGDYVYAHELGHLIGACHDIDGSCASANRGNVYESYCDRSVMAYPDNCPSNCGWCTVYPQFTAGYSWDEGYNNRWYMDAFAPTIAALY